MKQVRSFVAFLLCAACALAHAQTNWIWANPSPQGNTLRGATWHAGQFVAVGENGTILASPDGSDWAIRTSNTTSTLASVAWHDSQFVAAGEDGTVLTSADGVAWTKRSPGTNAFLNGLAGNGAELVAVGDGGAILTSVDAVTWTARNSATTDNLHAVAWNGSLFVAVGGSPDDFSSAIVLTSPDGITWTPRDPKSARCLFGLAWNGAQWMAVGASGAQLTSADGLNWKLGSTGSGVTQRGLSWNGTTFIAVGQFGTILTSTDGTMWADRSSVAASANDLFGIAGDGSQSLAVGAKGTLLNSTAMDASSWASFSTEIANASPSDIVWDGSQFVVADFNRGLLISPDGIDWTVRSGPAAPISITWTGNRFALTTEFGEIWTSTDAVDWTNRSAPIFPYNAVAGNVGTLVGVGGRDTFAMFIATSTDGGATWKDHSLMTTSDRLQAVLWNGNQFVSVGSHGRVMTSPDGETWTARTSGTTAFLSGIAWDGHQFVVVGDTAFLTSPDAATWTAHAWGALPAAAAIAWNGHDFVAVGDHGAILSSTDGVSWSQVPALTNHPLSAVAASGSPAVRFVAAGGLGDLLYSNDDVFMDTFESVPGRRPSLHAAVLPRNRQAQCAATDQADPATHDDTRAIAADDCVQLARPAEKSPLRQGDHFVMQGQPVRNEIGGSRSRRAAGRDVFDAAVVVPGAALAPCDVEHVDELCADGGKQRLEAGRNDSRAL